MNPREETDLDGDDRLIAAMRELCQVPAFSLGEEIAKWNQGARMADDWFCPQCGKRGIQTCNCEG